VVLHELHVTGVVAYHPYHDSANGRDGGGIHPVQYSRSEMDTKDILSYVCALYSVRILSTVILGNRLDQYTENLFPGTTAKTLAQIIY
jgi:hypothetical protein